jgi:hypothetical protein
MTSYDLGDPDEEAAIVLLWRIFRRLHSVITYPSEGTGFGKSRSMRAFFCFKLISFRISLE